MQRYDFFLKYQKFFVPLQTMKKITTLILRKSVAFWLTHAGLFLTLLFAGLGTFEHQRLHVRAFTKISENIAISDNREIFLLPFRITLKNFEAEFYDNHQSKSYKADIVLHYNGTRKEVLIQVNHPVRFMNYDIYLSSYDRSRPNPDYAIFLVIYDPWVYPKYVAILILLAGLFLYVWKLPYAKNKLVSLFILLFGLGFSYMVFSPYLFGGKNLVPALQSWWFVPHIAVYMFAYGALSVACLLSIYTLFARTQNPKSKIHASTPLSDRKKSTLRLRSATVKNPKLFIQSATVFSLKLGTFLMGIGLLFGALWAKEAWGGFWSFDLKENLAAIAWIAFLSALHFGYFYGNRKKTLSILIIVAYLLLQLCWFGINLLPESWQSLHRY